MRIAINGFGRIGRAVLRVLLDREVPVEVVAINDLASAEALTQLLRHDSAYGALDTEAHLDGETLLVGAQRIRMLHEAEPKQLPWQELGVELVIEATGRYTNRSGAEQHLAAGADTVLIGAPSPDTDITVVLGVNTADLERARGGVFSLASCTTNALAPLAHTLHSEYGIEQGFLSTVHAVTQDQRLLDSPHKDPRRARSALSNIIPTSTGASRTVGKVIPELQGRIWGHAIRVPVPVGSFVELHAVLEEEVTREAVVELFERAAAGPLAGILQVVDAPLVSSDIVGTSASSILDAQLIQAEGKYVSLYAWYDNEWGFSNRVVDAVERFTRPAAV